MSSVGTTPLPRPAVSLATPNGESDHTEPTAGGRPLRRVLFFGKSMSRSKATTGIVEALRTHGLDVRWLNLARLRRWFGQRGAEKHARRVFDSYQPDLVLVFCRDLWLPLLKEFRSRGTPVAMWLEEPMDHVSAGHLEYFACADAIFMTNPSHFAFLQERGIGQVSFVMDGVSTTHHHPWKKSWWQPSDESRFERDLVFIGGPGAGGQRVEFLAQLSQSYDLEIYGKGWDKWVKHERRLRVRPPVRARAFRKLCATSRIVLGINQINRDPLYFSNRTFLTLACRGFHLTHYIPGLERVFRDHEHLAWFRDLDECLARIQYFLDRPEERERIARTGLRFVQEHHLFEHRMGEILRVLGGGPMVHGPVPSLLPLPQPHQVPAPAPHSLASEFLHA